MIADVRDSGDVERGKKLERIERHSRRDLSCDSELRTSGGLMKWKRSCLVENGKIARTFVEAIVGLLWNRIDLQQGVSKEEGTLGAGDTRGRDIGACPLI